MELKTNPNVYLLPYIAWDVKWRLVHPHLNPILVSKLVLYCNGILIGELAASTAPGLR